LVAGIGNIFLSDDGFGPEVVRQLVRPGGHPLPDGVRVVDYGIRGMHLAYDLLDGYDALVLIDTIPGEGRPGELSLMEVGSADLEKGDFDAHGMEPGSVLASLGVLGGALPPTYIVGCCPATLEEGMGLSEPVEAAVPAALTVLRRLVQERLSEPETLKMRSG
jgi:hydrogenase maturation protease